MARVRNWQIGHSMSFWYPESRPKRQFAAVFDVNKCIACQSCTLACKTTWTSGKGQEYMLWNNVETKPWGSYPLAYDVKLLEQLGGQEWSGRVYEGRTIFEAAEAGERVLGWRPDDLDYAHPNVGEDDCTGTITKGAHLQMPHLNWFFYLARICNHCTYPACLSSCPRGSIYKRPEDGIVLVDQARCRGYRECVKACPYKKVFFNAMTGTSEKCIACYPKIEQGLTPQCFLNCIGKIRCAGYLNVPERADPENPMDFLVHVRKVALPLMPQLGLEPNVYYVPPLHTPRPFLTQMFGPGVDEAIAAYRNAPKDPDLAGLLGLLGSTERIIHRFKRHGETITGYDDEGRTIVTVPIREPTHVIAPLDARLGVVRGNVT
jgi:nitrate reductase / nitrite oxidoreductase, beta subunit